MAEHPIITQLRVDREKQDDEAMAKLKDYHSTITYVAAGALGFFLTVHEKFFHLQDGQLLWLFWVSMTLLFLCLTFYVVNILREYRLSEALRDKMDDYIKEVNFDEATDDSNTERETALIKIWSDSEKLGKAYMFIRLGLLALGLAGEIGFVGLNLDVADAKEKESKNSVMKIEWSPSDQNAVIDIDTSGAKAIKVHFNNK